MRNLKKVFIIAEIGSVHDGSFGNATKLIEAAAACGVDAVKFQTHIPEAETLPNAPMPPYFKGEPRFEYFRRTGFTLEQWKQLKQHCDEHDVTFLSSPFSEEAVDLLEKVGLSEYKIPSGEVTNLPMLEKIARLGKPVILSSGMSSWDEIDRAVEVIQKHDAPLTVLQCTSEYPCPYEQVGLNVMREMAARYNVPVGLSDHTLTNYAVFAAVTLGAVVVEKHFTFSRLMYGSDARHSLEPPEMIDLVQGVRAIERMLAADVEKRTEPYQAMKNIFEKSLVAEVDISAGAILTRELVGIKKPGTGISAARLDEFIGRKIVRAIDAGNLLAEEDFY
ncbi:MAG: N-acetylneuraminate synthase family protein [Anaerolineae bacterium]|nr:N-acetylneuraminate synthase family protein [Anaerolineae bacterium]